MQKRTFAPEKLSLSMAGRFIAIEGLDGAGKSTQMKLLRTYLHRHGISYKDVHYPRLSEGWSGKMVAEFLRGEYGGLDAVHPKLVALLFANDRHEHAPVVHQWLAEEHLVVADRYVYSNIAFQCAKLDDPEEKGRLRDWILEHEFEFNGLPRPAQSVFLDVPLTAVERSLSKERAGGERDYLNGKHDIHEKSMTLQQKVRLEYLRLTEMFPDFHLVRCSDEDGEFLPPESIHQELVAALGLSMKVRDGKS